MVVRYRTTDILILLTVVALLIGGYKLGYRLRVPHFLTGNFSAYQASEPTSTKFKTWHNAPPESLWDWLRRSDSDEKYAILQVNPQPLVAKKRTLWPLLLYDIAISILVMTLAIIIASRCHRKIKHSHSIKV